MRIPEYKTVVTYSLISIQVILALTASLVAIEAYQNSLQEEYPTFVGQAFLAFFLLSLIKAIQNGSSS